MGRFCGRGGAPLGEASGVETDEQALIRLLERELLRMHQLQMEHPPTEIPPPLEDQPGAALAARYTQVLQQNARLSAYQGHLQARLEGLEKTLQDTQKKLSQDPLTGLSDSGDLTRLLQECVEAARSGREAGGLILLELDHAYLERCLGAQRGYWLMRQAGQRLATSIEPGDSLGRWSDAQFLILLRAPADRKEELARRVSALVQRLTQTLERPLDFSGIPLAIRAYGGALVLDGEDTPTALDRVRRALAHARASGDCPFHVYGDELRERARRLAALQPALAQARSQRQIQIFYQPIVSPHTGLATMLETRLRWIRPQGVVEARQFVEVLEESGEILALDEWVLEEGCRQIADLSIGLCVNLTPGHLLVADLPQRIFRAVENAGLPPDRLCIELSEAALTHAPEQLGALARELSRMGISISIDGFGSRLSSLAGLPVRYLKLDHKLVAGLDQPEVQRLCRAALSLAHQMGIKVIAKRVENEQQVAWLREAGCDLMEGYFFSPPVPLPAVGDLLARSWR